MFEPNTKHSTKLAETLSRIRKNRGTRLVSPARKTQNNVLR